MLKDKKIGIIICIIIIAIALLIGFGWKLSQLKTSEEKPLPEGGGSVPITIPCLVLDKEYCEQGKPIYNEEKKIIGLGFKLPAGTKIYTPFDGAIDDAFAARIFGGVYYGFEIWERTQQVVQPGEQRNYFNVVGDIKTTIEPTYPAPPGEPERLIDEPVQKEQPVAETIGEDQRIITSGGNYDIVIGFETYDTAKNIWSHNIDLLRQYFPYVKE